MPSSRLAWDARHAPSEIIHGEGKTHLCSDEALLLLRSPEKAAPTPLSEPDVDAFGDLPHSVMRLGSAEVDTLWVIANQCFFRATWPMSLSNSGLRVISDGVANGTALQASSHRLRVWSYRMGRDPLGS